MPTNKKYSIVRAHFQNEPFIGWVLDKEIHCASSSTEEQLIHGMPAQGNIIDLDAIAKNELPLAINGDGYFHVKCGKEDFLTRIGDFHKNEDGILINELGCALLDRQQNLIVTNDLTMTQSGCLPNNQCISAVPHSQIEEFEKIDLANNGMIQFTTNKKLKTVSQPLFIMGSLEDQSESLIIASSRYKDSDSWQDLPKNLECNR